MHAFKGSSKAGTKTLAITGQSQLRIVDQYMPAHRIYLHPARFDPRPEELSGRPPQKARPIPSSRMTDTLSSELARPTILPISDIISGQHSMNQGDLKKWSIHPHLNQLKLSQ